MSCSAAIVHATVIVVNDESANTRRIGSSRASNDDNMVIGEVVEAATASFVAQCVDCERTEERQLFEPPEFGSLIKIRPMRTANDVSAAAVPPTISESEDEDDPFLTLSTAVNQTQSINLTLDVAGTLYAAVSHASMTTLDAGRRPTALGYADEDELRRHQPQIFELITTEFAGVLLAYSDSNGHLRRSLPPRPPRLHSRVLPCTDQEVVALTEDLQFMRRILNGSIKMEASASDLCAAILRHAWSARAFQPSYLQQAGLQLSALLGSDYEALQTILTSVVG